MKNLFKNFFSSNTTPAYQDINYAYAAKGESYALSVLNDLFKQLETEYLKVNPCCKITKLLRDQIDYVNDVLQKYKKDIKTASDLEIEYDYFCSSIDAVDCIGFPGEFEFA